MSVSYNSQVNFNGGIFGTSVVEREDVGTYVNAVAELLNFQTKVQGPAFFRSGTQFIAEVKNSAKRTRLIPFEFSTDQAYLIESGENYFRFFKNRQPITVSGSPYEVAHTYSETVNLQVNHAQSADVLYLNVASQPEYKLTRTSDTNWTNTKTVFNPPPFKSSNVTGITLTASAVTGTGITLTASSAFFSSLKIGAQYQIQELTGSVYDLWKAAGTYGAAATVRYEGNVYRTTAGGISGTRPPIHTKGNASDGGVTWTFLHNGKGRVEITAVASGTSATANVLSRLPDSALSPGTDFWRESIWNPGDGYPTGTIFFGDRRWLGSPFQVDGTVVQDYDNFSITSDQTGEVLDDSAVTVEINSNQVNKIAWLADDDKGLVLGTTGGEWLVSPSRQGEAITPRNRNAKRVGKNGCAEFVKPVGIDDATLFVQRNKRSIMSLSYSYEPDKLTADDVTKLAPELFVSGVVCMAYQRRPNSTLWVVNGAGELLGLTIKSSEEVQGWHKHVIGGYSDTAQKAHAIVEWVETLPAPDGSRDDVFLIVRRVINGVTKRYIELLTDEWDETKTLADMRFTDSHVYYSGAATTTLSGFNHLIGQPVTGTFNGTMAADTPFIVNGSGQITLPFPVTQACVGLAYAGRIKTLPRPQPSREGSSGGKVKAVFKLLVSLMNSIGGRYGNGVTFYNFEYPKGVPMDVAQPLFTGTQRVSPPDLYNTEGSVTIEQTLPFPLAVRAIRWATQINNP
jgi:hypothetical protein